MVITNWGMDENEVSLKKVLGRLKPKTSLKLVIISVESRKIQDPFLWNWTTRDTGTGTFLNN